MWRPSGKLAVGFLEVEWLDGDVASPSSVDPARHLAGRLFYPCAPGHSARAGAPWFPGYTYAKGLARFLLFHSRSLVHSALRMVLPALAWLTGKAILRLALHPGAPPLPSSGPLSVVVVSHGLGGSRAMYSLLCTELASQGFAVLAVEHADGSASACRLAGGQGWRLYGGLGDEAEQLRKTRFRLEEMKTALRVLGVLNEGTKMPGLTLSHGADASSFVRGTLDLGCLAAIGHSLGGATIAALVAEDPRFSCGLALDPYWYAVPPDSAALVGWRTCAPLLVLASEEWQTPNVWGDRQSDVEYLESYSACALAGERPQRPSAGPGSAAGSSRQDAALAAAAVRAATTGAAGGGAILLALRGTVHRTFADVPALLCHTLGAVPNLQGLASPADPELMQRLTSTAALYFISRHMPLTPQQRALQSWTGAASNSGALQDEASSKAVVQSEGVIGLQRSWAVEAGDGDRYRLLLGVPNICVCQVSA